MTVFIFGNCRGSAFPLFIPLFEQFERNLYLKFVGDCVKQEIIKDDYLPSEILLHFAGIFIIILLFKCGHTLQRFFAMKITDVIPITSLNFYWLSKIGLSCIGFTEDKKICPSECLTSEVMQWILLYCLNNCYLFNFNYSQPFLFTWLTVFQNIMTIVIFSHL